MSYDVPFFRIITNQLERGFRSWTSCTSLTLPNSITTLAGEEMFSGWTAATSLILPNSLTSITGGSMFMNWTSLTELTLPASLSGGYTFRGASSLSLLRCLRTTPPTITSNAFYALPASCVIEVPASSLTAYQTAIYWSALSSQMVGV
ncbi:leucine-rich repeat protein [Acinetobacter beijerinckii]|uniref:leucine-rich repeat protein n=1 Tax=Acinetobacter beijerinckii TaxID=262668 RepID=UPI003AF56388